jgi:hypothetical protein
VLSSPDAWQPSGYTLTPMDIADESGNSTAQCSLASESEFYPPSCAETAFHLVEKLSRRAGWLQDADYRAAYVATVPKVMTVVCDGSKPTWFMVPEFHTAC